jgi:sugar phosphate isomerase/epimerase
MGGAVTEPKLVNLFWSAAGVFPGEGEVSPFGFVERVASAARAGFSGISFWHADLEAICRTRTLGDVRQVLDDHGVGACEVAFIEDWYVDGDRRRASEGRRKWVLEAAEALGAPHVKAGDRRTTAAPFARIRDEFARLCEDAAAHKLRVGYESMQVSFVHELADCLAMVEGTPNGGLIVDIAHTNAIGIANAEIAAIPAARIVRAELSDNVRGSNGYDVTARRFCGEGELDVAGFVAAIRDAGYRGPWAVEVVNRELRDWPLDRINETGFRTTLPFVS